MDLKIVSGPWCHDFAGIISSAIVSPSTLFPQPHPTPATGESSLKNQVMVKHENASPSPRPMTLGGQKCLLAKPREALGFYPPPSFFFLFSFICPLTVSSLNLINLSEGAQGKCDTEVGVIAEYSGRKGWGVVGGTGTLAWGQAAVLGCSWLAGSKHHPHHAVFADWDLGEGKGSFRDRNVMGTKGDVDGQCQPNSVGGCVRVCTSA